MLNLWQKMLKKSLKKSIINIIEILCLNEKRKEYNMGKFINKKIILIIIVLMLVSFLIPNNTVAATELSDMMNQARSFISTGAKGNGVKPDEIAKEFVPLGQILTTIGMGVMIAATTFLGIKYLTASPEGQAKLKEQLIGLVVAGIVVFGAYYIWKLAVEIVSKFD